MATHASTYGPVSKTVTCYLKSAISRNVTSQDRKSTRLNSSHSQISYAVFCLKKKKKKRRHLPKTIIPYTQPSTHTLSRARSVATHTLYLSISSNPLSVESQASVTLMSY